MAQPTLRQILWLSVRYTCECQDENCNRQIEITQAERRRALTQPGHCRDCLSMHHPECRSGGSKTYARVYTDPKYVIRCEKDEHSFMTKAG